MEKLEKEIRLLAYYTLRNHIGAKALADGGDAIYRLIYKGMRRDHGEKLSDSLINIYANK